VARAVFAALSGDDDFDQPRPRSAEHRGQLDPASGGQEAHVLHRHLRHVRTYALRAAGSAGGRAHEARRATQAYAGVRGPLPLQGLEGASGAKPVEGDREAAADRGDVGRARGAVPAWRT
jgi:hypothetical protein